MPRIYLDVSDISVEHSTNKGISRINAYPWDTHIHSTNICRNALEIFPQYSKEIPGQLCTLIPNILAHFT